MTIVNPTWRAVLLAAALGPALAACATTYTAGGNGPGTPMTVAQARQVVHDTILHYPGATAGSEIRLRPRGSDELSKAVGISRVNVTSHLLAIGTADDKTVVFHLAKLDPTFDAAPSGRGPTLHFGSKDYYVFIYLSAGPEALSPEPGEHLVDALAALKRAALAGTASSSPEDEARFAQVAKAYREAAVKPLPGEDVRRYVVQATVAVKKEDFYGAAEFYDEATRLAPWWPQGHFNRAFILAAIGEYGDAAREMQRYLALVPNAPNARQMQDKIYEWQARAPTAAPAAAIAAPAAPAASSLFGGALRGLQSK